MSKITSWSFRGIAIALVFVADGASGQVAPICAPSDYWAHCAAKVKAELAATNDPKEGLRAGEAWATAYARLYKANEQDTWPASDEDRLESGMEQAWDDTIGGELDPVGKSLELALKRYLPRLAAAVEFASGPYVTFFYNLLAPSPISNEFTAAKLTNAEINALVLSKLPAPTQQTIKNLYPQLFEKGFSSVKGAGRLP